MPPPSRRAGLASAAAGAFALVLAPLATAASAAAYRARFAPMAPPSWWESSFAWAIGWGPATRVYAAYGALWVPVVLLLLVGTAALRDRLAGERAGLRGLLAAARGEDAPLVRAVGHVGGRGVRFMAAGLGVLVASNVGDYWLGLDVLGQALHGVAFGLTLLGCAFYAVGSVLLGLAAWRSRAMPRLAVLALLVAPLGFFANALLPNMPAAFLAVAGASWVVLGLWLGSFRGSSQKRHDAAAGSWRG